MGVSFRSDCFPKMDENEKLSLYKHIDISIYPSVPYKILVQFTNNMADLFLDYFVGEMDSDPIDQANQAESKEAEIFFIKMLRIGNINVDISTVGFPIPDIQGLTIQVPAF